MKTLNILNTLASAAFLLLLAAACGDNLGGRSSAEVCFTASIASAPSGNTKAVYSGEGENNGSLLVRERIDWSDGDTLRIASDKAGWLHDESRLWADYTVSGPSVGNLESSASIEAASRNAQGKAGGLTWNKNESQHSFCAMYPSPSVFTQEEQANVGLDAPGSPGSAMRAFIPSQQYFRARGGSGEASRDFLPSDANGSAPMRYGWMISPLKTVSGTDPVSLAFQPVFTAFEFVIRSESTITLSSVSLESLGNRPLCGPFSVLTDASFTGDWYPGTGVQGDWYAGGTGTGTNYPAKDFIPERTDTTGVRRVTAGFLNGGNPITMEEGSEYRFTLLALPQAHGNLRVTFRTSIGPKSLHLRLADAQGTPITFRGCRKYRIRGLVMPAGITAEGDLNDSIIWNNLDVEVVDYFGWGQNFDASSPDNVVFGDEVRLNSK